MAGRRVIIVGAGVVGLTLAWRLRRGIAGEPCEVLVLERRQTGREASWAGGGILDPISPHRYPAGLLQLCRRSMELYPELIAELEEAAGFSVEYRTTGLMRLFDDEAERARLESCLRSYSPAVDALDREAARAIEPGLAEDFRAALHEPAIGQVRNPRMLKALVLACRRAGVTIREQCPARELRIEAGGSGDGARRCTGVLTPEGAMAADEVVLAAGAWSGSLLARAIGLELCIEPVHGEMLLLDAGERAPRGIVVRDGHYLIPRADGQVIVGSTVERRGFRKSVRLRSIEELAGAARRMVPALGECAMVNAWAGLRPGSPDRLPFIGRPDGLSGLVVSTGHFRNGLLLAPVSAELVARELAGDPAAEAAITHPNRRLPVAGNEPSAGHTSQSGDHSPGSSERTSRNEVRNASKESSCNA